MASLRTRALADGTLTHSVLFRLEGRQTSETFDTIGAARVFKADVERHGPDAARRKLDTRRGEGHQLTVSEQVRSHIDTLSNVTIGTRRRYLTVYRAIHAHPIGSLPLASLRHRDVAGWIGDLAASGLAAKTMAVYRSVLSAALGYAVREELIPANPAEGASIPRTEQREQTYLTAAEFHQLIAGVPERWHPLLVTLVGTGLRFGEVTALQVRDIHLEDTPPTLTVVRAWTVTGGPERITGAPKSDRGRRTIALPEQVIDAVRPLVLGRPADAWVFLDPGGQPITRPAFYPQWRRWVAASGLSKRPRVHDLRHTHASWLIAAGVPLMTVQRRLGHASISVTSDVYGHLMPESQVQAARAASLGFGPLTLPQIGPAT